MKVYFLHGFFQSLGKFCLNKINESRTKYTIKLIIRNKNVRVLKDNIYLDIDIYLYLIYNFEIFKQETYSATRKLYRFFFCLIIDFFCSRNLQHSGRWPGLEAHEQRTVLARVGLCAFLFLWQFWNLCCDRKKRRQRCSRCIHYTISPSNSYLYTIQGYDQGTIDIFLYTSFFCICER